MRADPLLGLDHGAVEQLGQHNAAVKQARTVLVGNTQCVTKTTRRHQQGRLALALKQRIGRHRGAHLYAVHQVCLNRLAGVQAQQVPHASHRRIAVLLRVVRQQLVRKQ